MNLWDCDPKSIGEALFDLRRRGYKQPASGLANLLATDPEEFGCRRYTEEHVDCLTRYGDPRVKHQERIASGRERLL